MRGEVLNLMNRQQRPNTLNSTRRFSVRLALATGATMATLLGSQTLALLEEPAAQKVLQATLASTNAPGAVAPQPTQPNEIQPVEVAQPTEVLPPAAPLLVVIRNPGAVPTVITTPSATQPPASNAAGIVPPKPVAIQAPPPKQAPAAVVGQPAGQPPAPSVVVVQPAPAQPAPASQPSRR